MDYDTKLKCAIFYFRLRDETILPLKYELQPNSLREKWIQAVRMKEKDENSFLYASFSNKNENDLEYLKDLGNSIINDINTFDEVKELYGDGRLPLLQGNADKVIDQELMNELHEKDPAQYPRTARDGYVIDPLEQLKLERSLKKEGEEIKVILP